MSEPALCHGTVSGTDCSSSDGEDGNVKHASTWTIGVAMWVGLALSVLPLSAQEKSLRLSGFVDTSFFYESLTQSNTFSLDQVELDIEANLTPWAGFRTDINFLAEDSENSGLSADGPFNDLTTDEVLEQGFIYLKLPLPFETTLSFGKFNAPIGWELLDPPDLYQFSNSLTFNFGIPTNLTGALFTVTFSPLIDLNLYVVNGWDVLTDNNKMKTFGGRLGLTLLPGVNVGLSLITGPEQPDNDSDYRTVFDLDFTIELIARLLIGGEFNYGYEENAALGRGDADWTSVFVTLHYDFTDIIGFTFRVGVFDDSDGARLADRFDAFPATVTSQTAYALTFSPTFELADGVSMLVEFRYDGSDEDVFPDEDENFQDDFVSIAIEFIFVWEKTLDLLVN